MSLEDFPKPNGVDIVWYEVKFHQSEARVGPLCSLALPQLPLPNHIFHYLFKTQEEALM
jgi:hypothetical protein